ncbi:MAG: glycosyltransferase family 2 protein [Acidobacteria bacterium]|nr:glycosyltransferase family 2 protein [Acidobacteriota bacterium]
MACPSVWAVVLNCNGASWLKRCLGSLLACSYPRLQLLMVDNASTDGSVALARRISSRIEVIENNSNLGFCAGNNAAIDYALQRGADYVALLNNDTYAEPDWLDRLVEVGEAHPQVGILGPVQLVFDGDQFNSWTTSALAHLLKALERDESGAWLPVEWVEGSCLVAKRRVLERIGRLDPIFFIFFEEIDLCRRARAAGFQVAIVPSSRIHHHRGGYFAQPRLSRRRDFLRLRNSIIYNSTDPRLSLLGNLQGLLLNDAVHFKDALLKSRNPAVWLWANCSLLSLLPALYRKWRADREMLQQTK